MRSIDFETVGNDTLVPKWKLQEMRKKLGQNKAIY